jgi:hypothetical protein
MKTNGQHEGNYIVIGWFVKDASNPNEDIVQISPGQDLFTCLHDGIRKLEGWSRWFSLKSLSGFGIYLVRKTLTLSMVLLTTLTSYYKCNGPKSTVSTCHTRLDTHPELESQSYYEQVQVLSQFFAAYQSSRKTNTPSFWKSKIPVPFIGWWKWTRFYLEKARFLNKHNKSKKVDNNIWSNWIKAELNGDGVGEITEYKYSVELQYSWSSVRVCLVLVPPLLLSFAIGIWYMLHTKDVVGDDRLVHRGNCNR